MRTIPCHGHEFYNTLPPFRPLFAGDGERDQLLKIFHVLGLPASEDWPAMALVPRGSFIKTPPKDLEEVVPPVAQDPLAKNLLKVGLKSSDL